MAMTAPSATPAATLAQQLQHTRGQGIAVFVQERVHSTTVGVDATTAFVQQLLTELEDAISVLQTDEVVPLELSDELELELGTLLSAASLTIRYVTERDAMTPVLGRFRAAFQSALRFPLWSKPLLGLKMVSLMGITRLLESFGDHVDAKQVEGDLLWLFAQFAKRDEDDDNAARIQRINYLFRPACEQLTVALQSHPSIQQTVYDKLVPVLFQLAPTFDASIHDAVAGELLATIAVIFDLRLPPPSRSAFALLPMPAFAQESASENAAEEENIHILQREDEAATPAIVELPSEGTVALFVSAVELWATMVGRRQAVAANLPHLCGAMAAALVESPRAVLCNALLSSLKNQELQQARDFELLQSSIECVRDIGLRNGVPSGLEREIFIALKDIMPRLQAALKTLDVDQTELRMIKATCSKTRDVLVEAFVWWIHYTAGTDNFAPLRDEFMASVVDKLADPRIHGDVLFASRPLLDAASFEAAVEHAVSPLLRAIKQLDRYSKVAASRVIAGVARVAVGAGGDIGRFVDLLAVPLLQPVVQGSRKGKTPRLNAIACLLLACSPDALFSLDDHDWVSQLINALLEASAAHSVHGMMILDHLVRYDTKIRGFVAGTAASSRELVSLIVQNSLNSWPIFTEDMDSVLLVLAVLSVLLEEDTLRNAIDVSAMTSTIEKLRQNAKTDEQSDLVEACDDVLKALSIS